MHAASLGESKGLWALAESLLGDLALDSAPLRAALGWTPPFTLDEGLAASCRA